MTVWRDYRRLWTRVSCGALVVLLLAGCARALELRPITTPSPVAQQVPAAPATAVPREQLLAVALDQRSAGEYRPMAATLDEILHQPPDAALGRRAAFHRAEAEQLAGNPSGAISLWTAFLADPAQDEWTARAHFFLARVYEQLGRPADAIAVYKRYRSFNTAAAPYALARQAAQEAALGDTAAMLESYEQAAAQPIARSQRAPILETLISTYADLGRADLQLARYQDLVGIARRPDYRPDVLLRAARAAAQAHDPEQQSAWLGELVEHYPDRPEAVVAIEDLEAMNAVWSPLPLARSLFLNERYAEAVDRFDMALGDALSDSDRLEARRMRALAVRALGHYDEALAELGSLAADTAGWVNQRQAELDYIQTLGHAGDRAAAITGYRQFALSYPADALAPEALWRAIQLEARSDELAAMRAALELGRSYGKSEQSHVALPRAALYFRNNTLYDDELLAWQLLGRDAEGSAAAQGRFWAGALLLEAEDTENGRVWLKAATEAAPESYYAARARELLRDQQDTSTQLAGGPTKDERHATEEWIAAWTGRPAAHVDAGWLREIAGSPEVMRARELAALDLRREARDEWLAAKEDWNDAPEQLWQLAVLATLQDQPYPALKMAERIVELSPTQRITTETPTGLLRLIFPTPYSRVARQQAEQSGFDPRLLYAVLRQESLFNPDATSSVGARGLGQVMPSTAEGIAQQLNVVDFAPEQLWLPSVSLRFGAWYLGQQLRSFGGSVQAAAAAYNGGPGNAARWIEMTADTDRMVEMIDYRETRDYVKRVYGNWGMYRMLYGK